MIPWLAGRSRFHGRPPVWWPAGEPWPPQGTRFHLERRRARFIRRSGWYSFWPLWILLWVVASVWRGRWGGGFPISGGVVLILACAAAAGTVALIIRWMAGPLAD